jgi:hypothetical protein
MPRKEPRWRRDRNVHIRRDYKLGETVASLGHEYGLSRASIYRILRGYVKVSHQGRRVGRRG